MNAGLIPLLLPSSAPPGAPVSYMNRHLPRALECRKIPQCPKRSCPVMRQLAGRSTMTRTSPSSQLLESVQLARPFPVGLPRGIADAIVAGGSSA